ncbi:hypothetical protein ACFPME_05375 [Rhodanobacter umsongensis]|uniref:Uncharacterized protein n=1 Tax=Rhodanobacter umsongensis TaxID=633153 RepID=A0ABW0JIR9_9GAMM
MKKRSSGLQELLLRVVGQENSRIGVNAWLFDDVDAASATVSVIDGKNLW